jgi:hypothetical protein
MDPKIIEMSQKIAEVVAPNEIRLAPRMTEAFIKGGKDRESLFPHKKKNVLGGFGGPELIYLFPLILASIAKNCELISKILSPAAPVKNSLDILDRMKKHKEVALPQQQNELLLEDPHVNLKVTFEIFTSEMMKSGLSTEESESIAYRTLLKLLENTSSSIYFVKAVSETPNKEGKK